MEKLKNPTITEIIQKWPDGEVQVKYRRRYGSDDAKKLMNEVDRLPKKSGYSYRHV